MPRKYRFPGGPPPPLHVYGSISRRASAATAAPANDSARQMVRLSFDDNHSAIATAPGKKYGMKPKWRPIRKYSTLWKNRPGSSAGSRTFSASDSFVVIEMPRLVHVASGASNGNRERNVLRSPP